MGRFFTSAVAIALFAWVGGPAFGQQKAPNPQTPAQQNAQNAAAAAQAANQNNANAQAQAGVQFNYGGIGHQPWFYDQAVRQQLKLNADQYNRLNNAWNQNWTTYNQQTGQLSTVPEDQRWQRMNGYRQNFNKGFGTAMNGVLTPEQQQRYNQLHWQHQGYNAFFDPQVQQKLGLTQAQVQKLQQHANEMYTQQNDLNKNYRTDQQGTTKRFGEMRQRDRQWMNSFLTPEQRQMWTQMAGEPYTFNYGINTQIPNANPNR